MEKNKIDPVSLTVYGSAAVAVISFILPWIDVGMMGSANGFETIMFLLIIFWVPAIYTAVTKNLVGAKTQNEVKLFLNTGGGVCALIGAILFIFIKARISTPFGSGYFAGAGVYLFLLTAVALTFSNYLLFKRHN